MSYVQVYISIAVGQWQWNTIRSKDVRRLTGIADEPDGETVLSSYQAEIAVEKLRELELDPPVKFRVVGLKDIDQSEEFISWSPSR